MTDALINMLPSAIGVAVSPFNIVGVILILMSKRRGVNSLAYLTGVLLALSGLTAVILWLAAAGKVGTRHGPSTTANVILLVLGAVLLFLALKNWKGRPKKGHPATPPKWVSAIAGFGAGKSFALAFALIALNPKNLSLTIAGSLAIATSALATSENVLLAAVFVATGASTIILPVLYTVLAPQSASRLLGSTKTWLVRHDADIKTAIFLVLGLKIMLNAATRLW